LVRHMTEQNDLKATSLKSRKKRNKWENARNRLLLLVGKYDHRLESEPAPTTMPRKLVFGSVPENLYVKELNIEDFEKMRKLLPLVQSDASAYSLVLQSFLASMDIRWPDGVFEHDFAQPDSGRPVSNLSLDSWHLYLPRRWGWRNVAKELIPEEYKANADAAATKVRKAARSFIAFRQHTFDSVFSEDERVQTRLEELLGSDGLFELAWRVIARKFDEV
jgi:hypothetical protein